MSNIADEVFEDEVEKKPFEFIPNAKQAQFLASDDDVCMIAGGAGSGKSLVAIVNMLGLNDPHGPRYKMPYYCGLIYRKHYKDLRDLIKKSKEIYPLVDPGAKWVGGNTLTWTFSSGAQIYFQYFERLDQAETFFQGQELSLIHCDEIGQFEDESIMQYALSRLRDSHGLRCYFRASSNPSHYRWLREYFHINANGDSTQFTKDYNIDDGTVISKSFRYIQAKLSDNPYIPKEYQAQLMMMGAEDVNALLYGNWMAYDTVDGQIFELDLKLMNQEHRHCHVPFERSEPVYTAWDLGINDAGCVLFFQIIGKETHIIDMLLDNNKSIRDYYVPEIKRLADDKGYRYAGHYLPHDSAQRSKYDGDSLFSQVCGILDNVKALNIAPFESGIESTKAMFKNLWIDNRTDLYDNIVQYRRKWNPNTMQFEGVCHDKYSHACDALRYVSQIHPNSTKNANISINTVRTNPFIGR